MTPLAWLVGAYLVGSISFSYLVVWLLCGRDIREVGSRNAGATNVMRAVGLGAATLVLALDIAKGAAPALLAVRWGVEPWLAGGVALAAVLGHVFPIYLRFRGGKGVATAIGGMTVLAPWPTLSAAAVVLLLIAWTRYVSLGSIAGVTLTPLLMALWGADARLVGAAVAIGLLVIVRHTGNIRRLWSGTERRLGEHVEIAR